MNRLIVITLACMALIAGCSAPEQNTLKVAEELAHQSEMHAIARQRERDISAALELFVYAAAISSGVGLCILIIGGARRIVAGLDTRSRLIYPAPDGQMPLYVMRRMGAETVHDANRAISATTIAAFPTPIQALRALVDGQTIPAPLISAPIDDAAMQSRVNAAHQVVQMISAATREGITRGGMGSMQRMTQQLSDDTTIDAESRTPRAWYETDTTGKTKLLKASGGDDVSPSDTQTFGKTAWSPLGTVTVIG